MSTLPGPRLPRQERAASSNPVGGFTSIWGTISARSGWRGRLVAGAVGSKEGWGGQELIGVSRHTRTREHPLVRIMGGEGSCRERVACIPFLSCVVNKEDCVG
ncbi:hypothetical protein CPB84DRAFT_370560 [Gymnopilus junonius]|uniref:Uncharacterized protein n=1 Tax=Gymnopilus junonius TaxID=109634 RepID=A0A9P5NC56_GYMJU|nr:hypothetical protein CPB84DRAFT_370560 [Gymnopilus junonius]